MSALGTTQALSVTLMVPVSGCARADVLLDDGPLPSGKTTLTIGDLKFSVGVLRSGFDDTGRPHAIVVAGLGWQSFLASPISFSSPAGVRLSTILSELSRRAGETIDAASYTDKTLDEHFEASATRPGEPVRCADVLNDLVKSGFVGSPQWRVDPDGVTRFGARTPVAVAVRADAIRNDASVGITTYGVDAPASFLPGNTVDGQTIGRIVVRDDKGKLELDVYTPVAGKAAPTVRDLLQRIVGGGNAERVSTSYVVHSVNGDGTLNLAPATDSKHLPEIKDCEQWTIGGIKFTPVPGQEVAVLYRGARRTRPIAFAFKLAAGPFPGAARIGDSVHVLLPPAVFSGTIGGVPATGVLTFPTTSTEGIIAGGSVRIGVAT